MQIVVNHVTRMTVPRICVAGVDLATRSHVRPTTPPDDPITRGLLREEGGPFGMGSVVDLGPATPGPTPPETEDHDFRTADARLVRELDGQAFLEILDEVASPSLEAGFGPDFERVGWKYAVEPGGGMCSLAVVRARRRPRLDLDDVYGRLQLRFDDPDPPTYLSVTDVRFFDRDGAIREDVVEDVAQRLRSGVTAYLMLGLARAFRARKDDRERHWLQLNGLVLVDRPVGDEP